MHALLYLFMPRIITSDLDVNQKLFLQAAASNFPPLLW
jgi:hypothetical protein